MEIGGAVVTILGALDAFPRRLAARAVSSRSGVLRRGLSRRTTIAVVGGRMAETWEAARIAERLEQARALGAAVVSERRLLALLGLVSRPTDTRDLSRRSLAERSGLDEEAFAYLALFDCFEAADEPFGFRDLVAAREYRRVLDEGADWLAVVRAVRSGSGRMSQLRLERTAWNGVAVREGGEVVELDGQRLFGFEPGGEDADALFQQAEEAEGREDWLLAADLYRRCMALEPRDPTIPFNLSTVLDRLGGWQEARHCLTRVLKLDAGYVEAWYNLAVLAHAHIGAGAAARYFEKAIAVDPNYADAIYNLALLAYQSDAFDRAAHLWSRYLELDPGSQWGQKARHGLQLIAMAGRGRGAGDLTPPRPGLRTM